MYRSMLVPLDGSPESEQALPLARSLALHADAALHLVHVHVPLAPSYAEGRPVIDAELHSRAREHERTYLQTLAERLALPSDVPVTVVNPDGPVVPTLLQYATANAIDLIVMTTHGRGGLARAWLGSVADALIRHSATPILLLRPQQDAPTMQTAPVFRQVLIPLDGSSLAEAVLEPALTLGRLTAATYTLVEVVAPMIIGASIPGALEPWVDQEWTQQRRAEAATYLQQVAARLHAAGEQAHTEVLTSPQPAAALLNYARTHGCDLIALATHGVGGVVRLLLGSVADKVVRGAEVPVLVYRPQAPTEQAAPADR